MNSIQFGGVYGVVAQSSSTVPSSKYFNLSDVKKALQDKAAEQKVSLATDPGANGAKRLPTVSPRGKEVPPVSVLASPFFDDKLIVFTQDDAKAFEGYKADVEQYWASPKAFMDKATKQFDATFKKVDAISEKISKQSKMLGDAFGKVSLFLLAGAAKVLNLVESTQHSQASALIMDKWSALLNKIPADPAAFLKKEDVLKAITDNKFNTETGQIQ